VDFRTDVFLSRRNEENEGGEEKTINPHSSLPSFSSSLRDKKRSSVAFSDSDLIEENEWD
jgi:hypothetical protein